MNTILSRLTAALGALVFMACSVSAAKAQTEIPPPSGKGRVVVVSSGQSGVAAYQTVAKAIAQMGYDVLLVDGNAEEGTRGQGLKTAIASAQQLQHALPGKVALVGFSLGGGISLAYGSHWPDQVAVDIVWYPVTSIFHDIPTFVSGIGMPVLMLAGEADSFRGCCLIGTAHSIATAATAAGKSFELVTYPHTDHDFVPGGLNYNQTSYEDALSRTQAELGKYMVDQ